MQILSTLLLEADPNRLMLDLEQSLSDGPENFWTPGVLVICAMGVCILILWQVRYGGPATLRNAPVRRNRLLGFEPVVLFGSWLLAILIINLAVSMAFGNESTAFQQSLIYPALTVLEIALIGAMLYIGHYSFARRLKGLGLNIRTAVRDAGYAVVYLAAVYPLILLALWVVLVVGSFFDENFSIQQHQTLSFLTEDAGVGLRILIMVFSVFIVPVFEEILFRGFLQTTLRSFTRRPWAAIVLTSVLFSLLHPATHILAIFFLSCGLGYAYERSGSLLRSILMHIFFNGFSVAATFLTT